MGLANIVRSLFTKKNVVESTALCLVSNPAYTLSETQIGGLSTEQSLVTRAVVLGATYVGFGKAYASCLTYVRRFCNAEEPGTKQSAVDTVFSVSWVAGTGVPLYLLTTGGDVEKTKWAVGVNSAVGLVIGGAVGAGLNVFNALLDTGDEHTEHALPRYLQNASTPRKLVAASLLAAGLVVANAAVYAVPPWREAIMPRIEQLAPYFNALN